MPELLFDCDWEITGIIDDDCLRTVEVEVVAWVSGENVYNVNRDHAGWFADGVLYDSDNETLAYLQNAKGYIPFRQFLSGTPGMPGFSEKPYKPVMIGESGRPSYGSFSSYKLKDYFQT